MVLLNIGFSSAQENKLDDKLLRKYLSSTDTIYFKDFVITIDTVKIYETTHRTSCYVFKKGKCIFSVPISSLRKKGCEIGLIPFIPGEDKKLFLHIYDDGMEYPCYWIIDLANPDNPLYESTDYNSEHGRIVSVGDYDGDGYLEFAQAVSNFEWICDDVSHASTPSTFAIFKYSVSQRKFILANKQFSKLILSDTLFTDQDMIDFMKNPVYAKNPRDDEYYLSNILSVFLNYTYGGQENKGWQFFNRWYGWSDKEKMKLEIKDRLKRSDIYNQLYQK